MTSFRIEVPGGQIAGRVAGSGPSLVLLGGLGASHRVWGELPELLGRRFRVFAPDSRGIGGSTSSTPFTLAAAAADLVALLDGLGVERAALLGASLGGTVALEAALLAPERFSRLAIASAAAHLSAHGRALLGILDGLLREVSPEAFGRVLTTLSFAPPFAERHPSFVRRAARAYGLAPDDLPGTRSQLAHLLGGWDQRPRLPRLTVPTLVLVGARDAVVAAEDTRELAARVPDATLVEIPEAGHSVLVEGGRAVLDRVLAHLEEP